MVALAVLVVALLRPPLHTQGRQLRHTLQRDADTESELLLYTLLGSHCLHSLAGEGCTRRSVSSSPRAVWNSVGMAEGVEGRLAAAKEENTRLRESLSEKDREIFLLKVRRGSILSLHRNRPLARNRPDL